MAKLTEEEKEKIYSYWFDISRCTEPANRPVVEETWLEIYDLLKEENPAFAERPRFIWYESAYAAHHGIYKETKQRVHPWILGSGDAHRIACTYIRHAENPEKVEEKHRTKLRLAETLVRNGFWSFPFTGVCFLVERPCEINWDFNAAGRRVPSNNDGPAIAYRDGYATFAVGGVIVPRWIIEERHNLDNERERWIKAIKKEENAEIKRIMQDFYGLERYLVDIGSKVLDTDIVSSDRMAANFTRPIYRTLMEDDEKKLWLVANDGSTNRIYTMRAPNEAKTCQEAHEALWEGRLKEKDLVMEA